LEDVHYNTRNYAQAIWGDAAAVSYCNYSFNVLFHRFQMIPQLRTYEIHYAAFKHKVNDSHTLNVIRLLRTRILLNTYFVHLCSAIVMNVLWICRTIAVCCCNRIYNIINFVLGEGIQTWTSATWSRMTVSTIGIVWTIVYAEKSKLTGWQSVRGLEMPFVRDRNKRKGVDCYTIKAIKVYDVMGTMLLNHKSANLNSVLLKNSCYWFRESLIPDLYRGRQRKVFPEEHCN